MMPGGPPPGMGMMGMQPPPAPQAPPVVEPPMEPHLQGLPRELQHFAEMMPSQQVREPVQLLDKSAVSKYSRACPVW